MHAAVYGVEHWHEEPPREEAHAHEEVHQDDDLHGGRLPVHLPHSAEHRGKTDVKSAARYRSERSLPQLPQRCICTYAYTLFFPRS